METFHNISDQPLDIETIHYILNSETKLRLSESATERISRCRNYLDNKLEEIDRPVYGINTGFGALHNVKISDDNLMKLQENLVMSHACGTGSYVPVHTDIHNARIIEIHDKGFGKKKADPFGSRFWCCCYKNFYTE